MQNIFIDVLPPWVETGLQPAFYDLESGTVLQQTARMYARVNLLTESFNTFSQDTTTFVNNFVDETNAEIENFEHDTTETVNEYIEKFNQLHDYVEDYFENLDVQEEINNKLDAMVEDGTLQEIITTYIQSNVAWTFDTVANMKLATNLIAGSYARTLGYHSVNDGGGALYLITDTGTANEMDVIACDSLYANIVIEKHMTFEQFGAYGDGTHDDATVINYVLGSNTYDILPRAKVYAVGSNIEITPYRGVNFNNATLKALTADMKVVDYYQADVDTTWQDRQGGLSNLAIDCNDTAGTGLRVHVWQKEFNNIRIYNVKTYGIHFDGGYENHFNNIRILSNGNNSNAIGWKVEAGDSTFDNITGIDLKIFWDDYGRFNEVGYAHAWILTQSLSIGSKMFNLNSANTKLTIDYAYVDTYHYGFYNVLDSVTATALLYVGTLWFIVHPTIFDFSGADRPTVFSAYGNYSLSNARIQDLHVESVSASNNTVFYVNRNSSETSPAFTGYIYDRYIGANTTGTYNLGSSYSVPIDTTKFDSIGTNIVRISGRIVTIDFVGKLLSTSTGAQVIGTLPSWLAPYNQNLNTCAILSEKEWGNSTNPDVNIYLFVSGSNGQIQIRTPDNVSLSTYPFLKFRITYLRQD